MNENDNSVGLAIQKIMMDAERLGIQTCVESGMHPNHIAGVMYAQHKSCLEAICSVFQGGVEFEEMRRYADSGVDIERMTHEASRKKGP